MTLEYDIGAACFSGLKTYFEYRNLCILEIRYRMFRRFDRVVLRLKLPMSFSEDDLMQDYISDLFYFCEITKNYLILTIRC